MMVKNPGWPVRAAYGVAGIVVFVLLWKAAGVFRWVNPGTLPDPFALPDALAQEWTSGRLLPAVGSSLIHYFWGLALGTLSGIAVGLAAATIRRFDLFQAYLARVLRPIPPLAWVVFAIAWFKVSHAGAAFVIAIGVFWVNYFATYSAVRNIDPRFYELARSFGQGSYWRRAVSITLPAIAPGTLAGVRTGIGQAWMTLIAAELLGVPGMGQEMNAAAGVGAYEAVVVYMLAISLVYAICDLGYAWLEKKVLSWRP
ncbi:ABC transporter permease [Pigmentiphaga kullae]|uniref:NitT/TauT family transport system permease protein n=1 Tax=Pigmentiphaga kullae TaxID=151784 RepID=A0A4Q7NMM8_9BURK|nr:ABC transporter permease subunit [Pigmentiphaga kullae]RZS86454.1 NitT/TauT family transport system permease protein [Pigmentiphaga kullae]